MDAFFHICPILACDVRCAMPACGVFAVALVYASAVDMRERIIPNRAILCAVVVWAVAQACSASIDPDGFSPTSAASGLFGAFALAAGSMCAAWAASAVSGRESLGAGDVKLLFAAGLYLGPFWGTAALFVACALAASVAFVRSALSAARRIGGVPAFSDDGTFPFAPYFSAAVLLLCIASPSFISAGCMFL